MNLFNKKMMDMNCGKGIDKKAKKKKDNLYLEALRQQIAELEIKTSELFYELGDALKKNKELEEEEERLRKSIINICLLEHKWDKYKSIPEMQVAMLKKSKDKLEAELAEAKAQKRGK